MNPFFDDPDLKVDEAHVRVGFSTQIGDDVWRDKYRWGDERDLSDTMDRVATAIYSKDEDSSEQVDARDAMLAGLWMPAGRILAGAGTPKVVTLMNCYVNGKVEDSMVGILQANTNAALTMQQGGGDGTSFSTVRPAGARLKRTFTRASGPLPFIDMRDAMCRTIRSAGDRRGAMMTVLNDTHPDLPEFIVAKQTPGRWTNTNISVLVSDAFMEAIRDDEDWMLHFPCEPHESARDPALAEFDFTDEDTGQKQWVYSIWKARKLWEMITRNTYEYSEPGVIFIDRVNDINNLHYCEEIDCTNPCGEQPLPPYGTCNLGHVILSRMVRNPFKDNAHLNFELLRRVVRIGVRFLDNVIDVTNYPLPQQETEEFNKRRIGLGFTGLGDALAMLKLRYGSPKAADITERIQQVICEEAYDASVDLAEDRGPFPMFNAEQYLAPNTFAGQRLPADLQNRIRKYGIRNGVLMSIAPTGTTSIVFGDGSGGLEPIFELEYDRKVRGKEIDEWNEYHCENYAWRMYRQMNGDSADVPSYMVTTKDLTVEDHITMQARVQRWVDASVSKTVNCPEEMTYEEFVRVYDLAYQTGCKGCATYRPSAVRGSILSTRKEGKGEVPTDSKGLAIRPRILSGKTYKLKWPTRKAAIYVTINDDETGRPFEMFITSKDGTSQEWMTALSLMVTAIFRKGGDISFIASELSQIQSIQEGTFIDKVYYGSIPAYLGAIVNQHLKGVIGTDEGVALRPGDVIVDPTKGTTFLIGEYLGDQCPECKHPTLVNIEGCKKCTNCGYSSC